MNEPLNIDLITQAVSDQKMNFGESYEENKKKSMSRPYGVALMLAGVDENGPHLY